MVTLLYRTLWSLARGAAPLAGGGKTARALRGRFGGAAALAEWASRHRDTSRPLVWFHAASVGEGRQGEAVLVRLRDARPDWQVAWTHSSPSAEKLAASLKVDFAGYLPADTPADTARALDAVRPTALVFSATDLWPELVRQAAARGVRVALVSANLGEQSSRRGGWAGALLGDTWKALDAVGAIDQADAGRLRAAGVRPDRLTVTGDTRHDSALARVAAIDRDQPALRALRALVADAPLLVAGSTWPADERELLPALATVRSSHPLAAVIAPHEPSESHLARLEQRITTDLPGAAVMRLSALEAAPGISPQPSAIVLVDRVGILAELYAVASVAYVGGGFHDAGLHSVIEPAALGVPVVFGPRWQNSRDARLLLAASGAEAAANFGALAAALLGWGADGAARASAGAAARGVVQPGAAAQSLELILRLVEPAA